MDPLIIYKALALATVKLSKTAKAFSISLAAFLCGPCLAHSAMSLAVPFSNGEGRVFERPLPGPDKASAGARSPDEDVPASLCGIIDGMHSNGAGSTRASFPAGFPELLDDEVPVGTGVGYDLGPGLRFQGVGVFDLEENYASLGPAFTLSIEGALAITTGMQLPVTGSTGPEKPAGLYFAGFRLLF